MPKLFRPWRATIALSFCVGFLVTSCTPDALFTEDPIPVDPIEENNPVDSRLITYFSAFETAAAERGILVDLSAFGVEGRIEELPDDGVAGQCSYGTYIGHQVVIDETFFNRASSTAREMVIFHELGHCYLKRDHREDRFDNGVCRSIMRSGNGDCLDAYRADTRAYYLDELFELIE